MSQSLLDKIDDIYKTVYPTDFHVVSVDSRVRWIDTCMAEIEKKLGNKADRLQVAEDVLEDAKAESPQ